MPIHAGGRPFLAVMLGLSLVVGITPARAEVASAGPEGSSPLRVQISATGAARVAGDHETVTVTVTNTGSTPQQDVLVLLWAWKTGPQPPRRPTPHSSFRGPVSAGRGGCG